MGTTREKATITDLESESIVIAYYVLSSLRMFNKSNDGDDVTAIDVSV